MGGLLGVRGTAVETEVPTLLPAVAHHRLGGGGGVKSARGGHAGGRREKRRERGREGGREEGREGGRREGGKEGGRKGGNKGMREGRKEGRREGRRERGGEREACTFLSFHLLKLRTSHRRLQQHTPHVRKVLLMDVHPT